MFKLNFLYFIIVVTFKANVNMQITGGVLIF